MTRTFRAGLAAPLIALLAALGGTTGANAACRLAKVAELPVLMEGRTPTVMIKVNGEDARFELDTGAWYSMLSSAAADRYKVHSEVNRNLMTVGGVGGEQAVRVGVAREIVFAGAPIHGLQFIVGGNFGDLAGLLGDNFLSNADVEYDLANGVVRFWDTRGCGDVNLAYWSPTGFKVMPLERGDEFDKHIMAMAYINGQSVKAILDTGAGSSFISMSAAQKAGIHVEGPGVSEGGVTGGIGSHLIESWIAPVDSFELGNERILKTRMRVGRMDHDVGDMLLGADFFLSHRVFVSNRTRRLFFTYNGGPVFQLNSSSSAATKARAPEGPSSSGAADMDAAAYSRRGSAFLARRDLTAAIADFSKAADLEPNNAQHFYNRALAHGGAHQLDSAAADLDQAIKLKPAYAEALLMRGSLRLTRKDAAGAAADFAAAKAAAPEDSSLRLSIAGYYEEAGKYKASIGEYDEWMNHHSKYDPVWPALNGRCWVRAVWGRELDKALDDCNAALKKGGQSSQVLDSRGFVHLRLEQYAEAIKDYDAVLKLQPKLAWSMYCRGLARQRSGDQAGGATDIKAALAMDPEVETEAKHYGIIPGAAPAEAAKSAG